MPWLELGQVFVVLVIAAGSMLAGYWIGLAHGEERAMREMSEKKADEVKDERIT